MFNSRQPARVKEQKILALPHGEVPFTLITSRLARGIRISVSPYKGLEITVPPRYNSQALMNFIKEKEFWIVHNVKKINESRASLAKFEDGEKIMVRGQEKILKIISKKGLRSFVEDSSDQIFIHCNGSASSAKTTLEKHLKKTAKIYFMQKVPQISEYMGTRYGRITVRGQTSRWGSCARNNNLNFNWKLMFFADAVTDYVIMHELAHTVHHNHSERFYEFLVRFSPNYKALRRTLRLTKLPL